MLGCSRRWRTFRPLYLRSRYHQVALDPRDADKTAFITRHVTFVDWSSLLAFAAILCFLVFDICLVYLDDVIIFWSTPEQHLFRLEKVFERLRAANCKLKPSK